MCSPARKHRPETAGKMFYRFRDLTVTTPTPLDEALVQPVRGVWRLGWLVRCGWICRVWCRCGPGEFSLCLGS